MRPALVVLAALPLLAQDERAFVESLARLERQDPTGAKDLETASPLRAAALSLDPARASDKARFAAASWLWATSLIRGVTPAKAQTYLQAARNQPDLLKAWSLLETVAEDQARARDGLRLEIAWRLLDTGRMREAYASVARAPSPTVRELAHRLFVSAHLGEWPGLQRHAAELQAQGGMLEGLHAAAEQNPRMFDYASLLKAVDLGHPDPPAGPLPLRSHWISKWRLRLKDVSGSQKDLTRAAESWPKGWVDRPETTQTLLQVGAAIHWAEGPDQPPLSGFLEPGHLCLVGYRDAPGRSGEAGRQEQVWDLRSDAAHPGRWRGTHTLTSRVAGADPSKGPALRAVFEVEWEMRVAEEVPDTRIPAPAAPKPAP